MSAEKYMILIRGLSGSGKTTLADIICGDIEHEDNQRVSISVDDYFYDDAGEYTFNPEQLKEAHEWCKAETDVCCTQGFPIVVVHNTFTRKWEVEPYFEIATRRGYRVFVLNLYDSGKTDAALAGSSPHGIEIFNIRSQRKRWEPDVFRSTAPQHHPHSRRPNHRT